MEERRIDTTDEPAGVKRALSILEAAERRCRDGVTRDLYDPELFMHILLEASRKARRILRSD